MALNWTMLDSSRNPVPLPNEMNILTVDDGAELALTIPDTLPHQGASSGGSGGVRKLKETGRIHLTDQRVRLSNDPLPRPVQPELSCLAHFRNTCTQ